MISGGNGGNRSSTAFREVSDVDKTDFLLPFLLTENHLVYVAGLITDIDYQGIGTNTIHFSQEILQGESIVIK